MSGGSSSHVEVLRHVLWSVHFVALVRPPVGLVEEPLELPRDLSHPLATLFHAPPRSSDAPALRARLRCLVERLQLKFAPVVQHDDQVDESVEPRLPCRDPVLRVGGCIGDEV